MKIYIYGTGSGAQRFYNSLKKDKVEILGFLDSNIDIQGNKFGDYDIFHPKSIKDMEFDYILIASEHIEIVDFLISLKFERSKIIQIYNQAYLINKNLKTEFDTKNNVITQISNIDIEEYVITSKVAYKESNYLDEEFEDYFDYNRYKAFQLIANEIYSNDIKGEVAELGVYRGDFAKIINRCFEDRKLYLFDTFEGFDETEKKYDIDNNFTSNKFFTESNFKNTSINMVLDKMDYKDNCIIKKGYFPDTTVGLEQEFAFVSIDVDLFKPTYSALIYFYPRLSEGGYMFIHDYNNKEFFGVKEAIKKFENEYGKLKKIPIPDQGGTLIIVK